MFGNPLETQNLAYCVGQNQLIVLVMRCRLKHADIFVYLKHCYKIIGKTLEQP